MSDRWATQAKVLDVQHKEGAAVQFPDGTIRPDVEFVVDKETFERMKAGRICIICLEPQRDAFPQVCGVCGYRMADRQSHDLSLKFEGHELIGSRVKYQEEVEALTERDEFERRTGIVLPWKGGPGGLG